MLACQHCSSLGLTSVVFRLHVTPGLAAIIFLTFIVLTSLWVSFVTSAFISILTVLCWDYFFTQPLFSLRQNSPADVATTVAFLITGLVVARLVSKVKGQTTELEQANEQLRSEMVERTRAEEKIRQSEGEFRQLIDVIPQQVFVFDADWSPVFANRREREYTGLTPQEAQSKDAVARIFHPEDLKKLEVARERARSDCAPIEMEARIRGKDGGYRWFLIRDNPLRDEHGHVLRWYGTRTDIEDRRQAEEAVRRSEAYLAEAQKLTHTGSWASKADVVYWSDQNFRIWGFDPQHGPPTREMLWQRVHPEDRDKARTLREDRTRAKTDWDDEFRIVLPDETVRHIHAVGHPVFNARGEPVEFVGTHVDVTERKRAEEERERLRQLEEDLAHINRVSTMGELAASLGHEIKQPLFGIVTNGNACLRWLAGDLPNLAEARDATRRIVRDANRASDVVTRIRALLKKSDTVKAELDINQTIREIVALTRGEATRKRVAISMDLAADVPPVSGDRVQLQQVILNLILNGVDAMASISDRPPELQIASRRDGPDKVLVTVRDSGAGIDPQNLEKIFDAFYTTKPQGMGMGLAIGRSIVERHGGRLWAESNQGPGATFQFTLLKYLGKN